MAKATKTPQAYYPILPYIKTSAHITLRGITFRSSEDLEGVNDHDRKNLSLLFKIFFLHHDTPISRMVWATVSETKQQLTAINDAHQLIAFITGSMLSYENAMIFLMHLKMLSEYLWASGEKQFAGTWPDGTQDG